MDAKIICRKCKKEIEASFDPKTGWHPPNNWMELVIIIETPHGGFISRAYCPTCAEKVNKALEDYL